MRKMIFAGLAGLAGAYFFDPRSGARRRNVTRDRVLAFLRRGERKAEQQARYAQGVAQGVAHKAEKAKEKATGARDRTYDDATLETKVESEIFRSANSHKDRVNVNSENGVVFLRGQLESQDDIDALVAAARKVEGVQDVRSLLHLPGTPAPTA
jgi:osmotically-inducible protein OsmY